MDRSPRLRLGLWVLVLIPVAFGWVVILRDGVQLLSRGELVMGLVLLAIGAITAVLGLRALRVLLAQSPEEASRFDLRGPEFDYLMWTLIGLPLVLGAGLLILVLSGGLK